jgi:hypothetical protein
MNIENYQGNDGYNKLLHNATNINDRFHVPELYCVTTDSEWLKFY